jgi:hypothetical protein
VPKQARNVGGALNQLCLTAASALAVLVRSPRHHLPAHSDQNRVLQSARHVDHLPAHGALEHFRGGARARAARAAALRPVAASSHGLCCTPRVHVASPCAAELGSGFLDILEGGADGRVVWAQRERPPQVVGGLAVLFRGGERAAEAVVAFGPRRGQRDA